MPELTAAGFSPSATTAAAAPAKRLARANAEPVWVRRTLIGIALGFLGLFVVAPVAMVFIGAFAGGIGRYFDAITTPQTLAAIRLTLLTAAIVVPVNVVFGITAAWLLARFRFPGRGLLLALIDLPFSVSPVIAGLVFVLLFGLRGTFGPWLDAHGLQIVFATPGIVLATLFVTFPFVARELLPLMQSQSSDQEEAALALGATGFQMLIRITLPRVKWALLYGVVLCNARAMGEFGAVSVVSGHVRGLTNTLPLHVEILYNEYDSTGAFAVASLLTLLAFVTLGVKRLVERRSAP